MNLSYHLDVQSGPTHRAGGRGAVRGGVRGHRHPRPNPSGGDGMSVTVDQVVDRVMERIQELGGRATVPTRLVVSILSETHRHLNADDVIDELERRTPGIAPSTVYRVLQRLADIGVLEHVHSGAGATFYHLLEHAHSHLVCSSCGQVLDLTPQGDAALRTLTAIVHAEHGFELDTHHGALLGRCGACATSSHQARAVNDRRGGAESLMVPPTSGHEGPPPFVRPGGQQ